MPIERRRPSRQTVSKSGGGRTITKVKKKKDKGERWKTVTPPGIAGFCYLVEPDNYMGKEFYKATIKFPKDTTDPYAEQIDDFVGKVFDLYETVENKHPAIHKCPLQDGDELGHDSLAGFWVFNTKSGDQIPVYDGKKREIDPKKIWGGDLIRLGVDIVEMAKEGFKPSLSSYTVFVQLLEKRVLSGADALLSGVDDWEGDYEEAEEEDTSTSELDDDIPF